MSLEEIPLLQPSSYSGGFGIPQPFPDELCEMCGNYVGRPQVCTSDGRVHGHGMIHAKSQNFKLLWVCDNCTEKERNV